MVDRSRLELTYVSISAISQHPDNARNGDVEAIADSMGVNGIYKPIVVQKSTGWILAGNHTYVAALSRGETEIAVVFRDVTNAEARRIMLADNRTAALGWDDEGQLAALLESVSNSDAGFLGTGYQADDLAALLEMVETPMAPDQAKPIDRDDEEAPPHVDADRLSERADLKYGLLPTVSEDGRVYSLTLTKANDRGISAHEVNLIRKVLGMEPMQKDEIDRLNVPAWKRR